MLYKNTSYLRKLSECHRKMLTPGQLMAFRQFKYDHLYLPGNKKLDLQFLLTLDNPVVNPILNLEGINTETPIVLVILDSSYICKFDFMHKLFELETKYPNYQLVIINTGISYMETRYKLLNYSKYKDQNINWQSIDEFTVINKKQLQNIGAIQIIHSNFSLMHVELCKSEDKYSSHGFAAANTINDETQVNILLRYMDALQPIVDVLPIAFTCDMKMKKYCFENGVTIVDDV